MKRTNLRGAVPHSPFLSDNAVTVAHPAGVFDDPHRTGAVLAATTLLIAIGAIAIATMTGAGAGPANPSSESLALAVKAASGEAGLRAQQPAADPRGPRLTRKTRPTGAPGPAEAAAAQPPSLPYVKALPAAPEPRKTLSNGTADAVPRATGSIAQPPVKGNGKDGPDDRTAVASKAVPIADSEDQVVALEARMGHTSAYFTQPGVMAQTAAAASVPARPASPAPASAPAATPARHATAKLGAAATTTWVNMHVEPGNDARVIATVPARASIKAEANCKFWCQVEYDGRFGYIYKDFVTRPGEKRDVAASQ